MDLKLCERLVTMDRRRTARRVSDVVSKINTLIVAVIVHMHVSSCMMSCEFKQFLSRYARAEKSQ